MSNNNITLEKISSMFHMPEKAVAAELGMCLTSLKKIARKYGVTRWPYRKLKSLKRTMQKMNEDQSCLEVISTCVSRPSFPRLDEVVAGIDCAATRHAMMAEKDSGNSISSSCSSRGGDSHGCDQGLRLGSAVMTARVNSAAERDCHLGHDDQGISSSQESSWSGRDEEHEGDGSMLKCKVSGGVLSIDNWSELWTVASLRKHLLLPLGGSSLSFSHDGCVAHLTFTTPIASLQAKRVVELASQVIEDTTPFSSPSPSSSDADESEHDAEEEEVEEATPPPLSNGVFAPHSQEYYNLWAGPTSSAAQAQSSCSRGFIISPPCSFPLEDRQISGSVLSSGWSSFMAQGAC